MSSTFLHVLTCLKELPTPPHLTHSCSPLHLEQVLLPPPATGPWILWLTVHSAFCLATSCLEICSLATLNLHSGLFIHVLNHLFIHFYRVWYARLCVKGYMCICEKGGGSLYSGNRLLVLKDDDKWANKYLKQVVIKPCREQLGWWIEKSG